MAFPYEKQFRHYLTNKRVLADSTQQDICSDVERLFAHLRQFNSVYRLNPSLSNIEESDVRDYLNMLQVKREIKNSTYNKTLTHLNVYFTFLFTHKLSTSLPTISLKGLKKETEQVVPLNWADELEDCLKNQQLTLYTRMVLLCLSHFYTISEIIQPGFYKVLASETFNSFEQTFIDEFNRGTSELKRRQNCEDLFLKQRINLLEPCVTLPGIHKYLKKDQKLTDLRLIPQKLYQANVLNFIKQNQQLVDADLCKAMHLAPDSLNYYRMKLSILESTKEAGEKVPFSS